MVDGREERGEKRVVFFVVRTRCVRRKERKGVILYKGGRKREEEDGRKEEGREREESKADENVKNLWPREEGWTRKDVGR